MPAEAFDVCLGRFDTSAAVWRAGETRIRAEDVAGKRVNVFRG